MALMPTTWGCEYAWYRYQRQRPERNRASRPHRAFPGRTEGHLLPVIAQKALTGHSKGGAAAWQLIGLCQAMADGVVPPMRNLDEPDRRLDDRAPLVFSDEAIEYGTGGLRAGLLTSLGFGHVGAALCVAHPDVLLETLAEQDLADYASRRDARWLNQVKTQYAVLMGENEYIQVREN